MAYENSAFGPLLDRHHEKLKNNRNLWERQWQDIAEYVLPHRSDFTTTHSRGADRMDHAFEGSAMRLLKRFASNIHNVFTPMGAEWFKLTSGNPNLDEYRNVALWLEEATRVIQHHISRPISNFQSAVFQYYLEAGAFGTGIVFVEDVPGFGPRYRNFPLSDCILGSGSEMEIDTIFRNYKQTAKDIVQRFDPKTLPPELVEKGYGEKMLDEYDVVHAVLPAWTVREHLPVKFKKNFVSVHYLKERKSLLSISGYDEMPYVCARWERSDREIYGRGPTWEIMPDIRLITEVDKSYLKAVQKAISPPMFVPDSGLLDPLDTTPDAINYYSVGLGGKDMVFPAPTDAKPEYAERLSAKCITAIREGYFLDLLELPGPVAPDGDVMRFSATEVSVRMRQRMPVLGPILARQEAEFLDPVIRRTVNILTRSYLLPPMPEEMQDFRIEYLNPVSISMRSGEISSMNQLFEMIMPLAQIDQTIPMYFDTHQILQNTAQVLQVPVSNIRSKEEVQAMVAEQQRQQQEQAQMQQAQVAADVNQKTAQAENIRG